MNTLITFLLSGLWHGASGTVVFWGGIHGFAQIIEDVLGWNKRKKFRCLSMVMVFLFVTFAWTFFRADTVQEACYIIRFMFEGICSPITYIRNGFDGLGMTGKTCVRIGISLLVLLIFDWISLHGDLLLKISKLPKAVQNNYDEYIHFIKNLDYTPAVILLGLDQWVFNDAWNKNCTVYRKDNQIFMISRSNTAIMRNMMQDFIDHKWNIHDIHNYSMNYGFNGRIYPWQMRFRICKKYLY